MRKEIFTIILDCESKELTIKSLADIFNAEEEKIICLLESTNFSGIYESLPLNSNYIEFSDYIYRYFVREYGQPNHISYVYWFHLARSLTPDDYQKGIYPLDVIRPKLFYDLYELVKNEISVEQWNDIYDNGAGGITNGYIL